MWILLPSTREYAVGPFVSFSVACAYGDRMYPSAKREYRELVRPTEGIDNVIKMPQQSDSSDVVQESGNPVSSMQKTGEKL